MTRAWSQRERPHRELKVTNDPQRGKDVQNLQRAIADRGASRNVAPVEVDGEYGPVTDKAARRLGYLLGALESTLAKPHLTIGVQEMIVYPGKRNPAQLARAAKRKSETPPMRERAFAHAVSDLRVREVGGNNRGPEVSAIIKDGGGSGPEPWCGDAVASWYKRAGSKSVTRAWAYVPTLERLLTIVRSPAQGHVVIFNWNGGVPDHTGLFDRWKDRKAGWFYTIEGNTKPGSNESDGGGGEGVHRRLRNVSEVDSFRRVLR